jgi:hypothetical protein
MGIERVEGEDPKRCQATAVQERRSRNLTRRRGGVGGVCSPFVAACEALKRVSGAGWASGKKKSPVQGWAGTGEGGSSGGWKCNPRCVQEDLEEKRRRVKSAARPRPISA